MIDNLLYVMRFCLVLVCIFTGSNALGLKVAEESGKYIETVPLDYFSEIGLIAAKECRNKDGEIIVRLHFSDESVFGAARIAEATFVFINSNGDTLATMYRNFASGQNEEEYFLAKGLKLYLGIVLYRDVKDISKGTYRLVFDNT